MVSNNPSGEPNEEISTAALPAKEVLTAAEVMAALGVSRHTLWRLTKRPNGLRPIPTLGAIRYARSAVLRFIERGS
jgi:predicted DNA-binding transcriptional regulator AlpA